MRTVTLSHPFREGASASLAPAIATGLFDVAVAGRGYQLDLASNLFQIQSLEYMRQQQDQGEQAGEQSLSNTSLWRRTLRSWHLGAGQTRGDERDSSAFRYDTSKGVDPWTKYELRLLNDTSVVDAQTNLPIGACVLNDRLILQAGTTVRYSADGTSWSALATLASAPTALPVSDGESIFTACSDGQIKKITSGGTVSNQWAVASADVLAFAKGRLWAGAVNALYPLTPGGAVTAVFTHPWTGWRWSAICEGSRAVYAAGGLGDKSQIYRVPFKTDGTGFDAAVVAATLPDGELVTALTSYLGFVIIGTSAGVRFGIADGNGDLSYGALIETPGPVQCFEAQDRFIWFGWSDYDSVSTGLGRMDLSNFTSELTPAYASDLMYASQGDVTSVVTFGGKRYYTVESIGLIGESSTPVAAGTLDASSWTFGLLDEKIASIIALSHEQLDGIVLISLAVDHSSGAVVAESSKQGSTGPSTPFVLNALKGSLFRLSLTLVPGVGAGPVITGLTFSAKPTPTRGKKFTLPLLLSRQSDLGGIFTHISPESEQEFLEGLVDEGAAVTVQIGGRNYQAFPVDFRFQPYRQSDIDNTWTGTFVLELDEVTA